VIDAIMEKCGQNVNILHIKLDRNATECCVYMKTASQADAGRAFKALHGWWFDGNQLQMLVAWSGSNLIIDFR
jgi:inner nuclear membrane protein Man1